MNMHMNMQVHQNMHVHMNMNHENITTTEEKDSHSLTMDSILNPSPK